MPSEGITPDSSSNSTTREVVTTTYQNIATLHLEKQTFDWESTRVQGMVGTALIVFVVVFNYFGHLHFDGLLSMITASFFLMLVNLEITGLTGNRLKTTPAIWAGIILAVMPFQAPLIPLIVGAKAPNQIIGIFSTATSLASIFFFLRFLQLKEKPYLLWTALSAIIFMYGSSNYVLLPVVLLSAFILMHPEDPNKPPQSANNSATISKRTIQFNWRILLFLIIWSAADFFANQLNQYWQSSLLAACPLVLLIVDLFLPVCYTLKKSQMRASSALGCAILGSLFVIFSYLNQSQLSCIPR